MTGIGQLMAAGGGGTGGGTPFSAGAFVQGGASGVSVSTASGSTTAIPGGGERFFLVSVSGGTPPYSYLWQRQNGDNKTALESTTSTRAYVSWADMVVSEYQSTTARCRVRDATGATVYTSTVVIGVTRTA